MENKYNVKSSENNEHNDEHTAEEFFLNNFNVEKVFEEIKKADYLFLYYIRLCTEENELGRAYISDIAERMNLSVTDMSRKMQDLQDRGYVLWYTDFEAGRSYVELSAKANEQMLDAENRMKTSYKRIRNEIGFEDMKKVSQILKRIAEIVENPDYD